MSRVEAVSAAESREVDVAVRSTNRFGVWSACGATLAALAVVLTALAYAVLVAPGLPYDEPSHWGYVRWLAEHGSLPVLGEPSVGYEAQMGPLGYLFSAIVAKVVVGLGVDWSSALVLVRVAGMVPLAVAWWGIIRAVGAALPAAQGVPAAVAASVAVLNPMVVAMSLSVQNDTVVLALGAWLLVLVLEADTAPSAGSGLRVGVLAGAALLTKVVVAPAVVVVLAWPVLRWGRRGVRSAVTALAVAAVVSGWWFIRNVYLYGDVTGRAGVEDRLGITFPPFGLDPAHAVLTLSRSAVAYLWFPGEYFRSALSAPAVVQLLLAAVTFAVIAGGLRALCSRRSGGGQISAGAVLLLVVALASVGAWAITAEFVQAVAFRTAYLALPGYALLVAASTYRVRRCVLVVGAVLLLGLLHVWTLSMVSSVSYSPGVML